MFYAWLTEGLCITSSSFSIRLPLTDVAGGYLNIPGPSSHPGIKLLICSKNSYLIMGVQGLMVQYFQ